MVEIPQNPVSFGDGLPMPMSIDEERTEKAGYAGPCATRIPHDKSNENMSPRSVFCLTSDSSDDMSDYLAAPADDVLEEYAPAIETFLGSRNIVVARSVIPPVYIRYHQNPQDPVTSQLGEEWTREWPEFPVHSSHDPGFPDLFEASSAEEEALPNDRGMPEWELNHFGFDADQENPSGPPFQRNPDDAADAVPRRSCLSWPLRKTCFSEPRPAEDCQLQDWYYPREMDRPTEAEEGLPMRQPRSMLLRPQQWPLLVLRSLWKGLSMFRPPRRLLHSPRRRRRYWASDNQTVASTSSVSSSSLEDGEHPFLVATIEVGVSQEDCSRE